MNISWIGLCDCNTSHLAVTAVEYSVNCCRAIEFLESYVRELPEKVEPTHVNMLAQLYIEGQRFRDALEALETLMPPEACKQFPDLSSKVAVCMIRLGDVEGGMACAARLYEVGEDEEGAFGAAEYSDLFLDVRSCILFGRVLSLLRSTFTSSSSYVIIAATPACLTGQRALCTIDVQNGLHVVVQRSGCNLSLWLSSGAGIFDRIDTTCSCAHR
jgi:hypothetical protein